MTEHKFIDLRGLKMKDVGPGEISGYRSVFGIVDEGGDVVIKGAFADAMPEFLNSGFSAHSHDWTFTEAVGFPISAREDEHGWHVTSRFHSTKTAQDVRTIAKERLAAGKQVGFSFGYSVQESEIIQSADFEKKLPLYLKAEDLSANMAKARNFSQIRILKKLNAIEDSLVTVPMNKLAAATAVKGRRKSLADSDIRRLRSQSLLLRIKCLATLYGPFDQAPNNLKRQSLIIRERARRTLTTTGTMAR